MLKLSKLNLDLHFVTPVRLPYWLGSAFRGVFGTEIKKTLCSDVTMSCKFCEDAGKCLYYYVYDKETSKIGHAPPQRPIILVPPFFGKEMLMQKEAHINIDVLLLGDFHKYLPHVFLGLSLAGRTGISSERHYGMNRFRIAKATCYFSGKEVYDGKTVRIENLTCVDARDIQYFTSNFVKIGFRTPFTGSFFPPNPDRLLHIIRRRLIGFVNEYGDSSQVPDFECKGRIMNSSVHRHLLQRRSMRSNKRIFNAHTGVVEYVFDSLDGVGRWLLNLGFIIGCGPDSSFGCGFLQDLTNTL